MTRLLAAALGAALFLGWPSPAAALGVCAASRDALVGLIDWRWNEAPVAFGVTVTGNVIELLVSPKTWTLIIVWSDGRTCEMAGGDTPWRWEPAVSVPAEEASG